MGKEKFHTRLARWIADRLPKEIVYFAVIRAWANATTGIYGYDVAASMPVDTILGRWEN